MTDDNSAHPPSPDLAAMLLAQVRGSTPLGIEQIDILLRLISAARENVTSVLCLGADLSLLTAAILEEHPNARAALVDEHRGELSAARVHLEPHIHRVTFFAPEAGADWLPGVTELQPFDAIVSGAAFRPAGRDKRSLFADCFPILKPGGILLNVENVASATRWTESVLDDYLIDAIFGEALRQGAGKTRAEIAREHFARITAEKGPAPLEVQCDWLRAQGFEGVDCYSKVAELAVFGGQRPM